MQSFERAHQTFLNHARTNSKGPGRGQGQLVQAAVQHSRALELLSMEEDAGADADINAEYARGLKGSRPGTLATLGAISVARLGELTASWAALQGAGAPVFDPACAVRFNTVYIKRPGDKAVFMRASPSFHGKAVYDSGLIVEEDGAGDLEVPGMGSAGTVNAVLLELFFFYNFAGAGDSNSDSTISSASGSDRGAASTSDSASESKDSDSGSDIDAPEQCFVAYYKYAPVEAKHDKKFGNLEYIKPRLVDRTQLIVEPISALYAKVDVLPWLIGTLADPTREADGGLVSLLLTSTLPS